MLRILAWIFWIVILIVVGNLTIVMIPFRLTIVKAQMIVSEVRTEGSNIPRNYVIGTVGGRDKPIHLSLHGLMAKTTKFGSEDEFIRMYVNTGIPLDVVVGTMWFSAYDVAYVNVSGRPQTPNMGMKLVLLDIGLVLVLIAMYVYLRRTAPPAPPETPYINQPGGF